MKPLLNLLDRFLRPIHRRLRSARPGSVLILVVALLVIMAIIGTALISTARFDRYDVAQHAANVQFDMLVEGVEEMVRGAIVGDLFNGETFRPAVAGGDYEPYDAAQIDTYLASRVPENAAGPGINWPDISGPLASGQFESPWYPAGNTTNVYTNRTAMTPTWTSVAVSGQIRPAFAFGGNEFLAADADGDDIADSGLFRIAQLNGVTYYAAVRIIDNAAGINVNTAWSGRSDFDFAGAALQNFGFFQSNIGLMELLADYNTSTIPPSSAEMAVLNNYRMNGVSTLAMNTAYDDAGAVRADFVYRSQGDALNSQLAWRLGFPGKRDATTSFQAISDLSMAYRFILKNPSASTSLLESATTGIPSSVYTHPEVRSRGYYGSLPTGTSVASWFGDNFDYANATNSLANPRPLRALLVSSNAVSDQAPVFFAPTDLNGDTKFNDIVNPGMTAYITAPGETPVVARASVNTADFSELWRAFYNVMATTATTAPNSTLPNTGVAMFRSSLRLGGATPPAPLTDFEQLQLRAALAAVNTIDLRDTDDDVTSKTITLVDSFSVATRNVTVFGTERQPFITEVMVDSNIAGTKYVAVEIFNPLPWVGYVSTGPTDPYAIQLSGLKFGNVDRATMTVTEIPNPILAGTTLEPGQYLILHSSIAEQTARGIVFGGVNSVEILGLEAVVNHEFCLFRTRLFSGMPSAGPGYDEGANGIIDYVPIDQFDSTGWTFTTGTAERFDYTRGSNAAGIWKWVYPGTYTAGIAAGAGHQQPASDPALTGSTLGVADAATSPFIIQLNSSGMAGPNKVVPAPATNVFPYGHFAREGDILQIPFIGGYKITTLANALVELNSVTIDSFDGEDADAADDATECVGRFCPTSAAYAWTKKLFDYVTVRSPQKDYFPNVDPDPTQYQTTTGVAPTPVQNSATTANTNEQAVPIEGRININTAPWYVLAMLPLVVDNTTGAVLPNETASLAKAIVDDRNTNGPFVSIFDLQRVPGFSTPTTPANAMVPANPGIFNSDITPIDPASAAQDDGVAGDFESTYSQLTRISNLITTRSDSYTCYILVQGWRGADTASPELVTERRVAFIVDRSNVTAANSSPKVTSISTE